MSDTVVKIENVSKQYRLGLVGTNTLRGDFQRWWHLMRGKEDPTLKVGSKNQLDIVEGEYVWALRDINLAIEQGEVLGIIGKNGAGKSTLLKLLSQVTAPTTGNIKVKGRIASLLEVGTGFHPELTGRENIFLNGAILGMTKREIRKKLDEIIDFAGVARYINTPVKRYSSGMRVRLGFAVAAFLDPEILVVDEVLAVGDAEFQKKAIGKMKDISKGDQGRTVLFVSHNMASIQALCSRVVLLRNGQVDKQGDPLDIISEYLLEETDFQKVINVSDHRKRQAEECYFEEVRINNCDKPVVVNIGEKVVLGFKVYSERAYENISLSFNLKNEHQNIITASLLWDYRRDCQLNKGENIFEVHVEAIKLLPGKYYIDVGINSTLQAPLLDAVYDIPAFMVENKGRHQVVYRPNRPSDIYFPFKWFKH